MLLYNVHTWQHALPLYSPQSTQDGTSVYSPVLHLSSASVHPPPPKTAQKAHDKHDTTGTKQESQCWGKNTCFSNLIFRLLVLQGDYK